MIDILKKKENIYQLVKILKDRDEVKFIQETLNRLGYNLDVDGIIGYQTVKALINVDEKKLYSLLKNPDSLIRPVLTGKEKIMSYLAEAEGTIIHWNKDEKSMTSPYGIYQYSFPKADIFKEIQRLAIKYTGKKIRNRNLTQISRLNRSLTKKERLKLRDMAWEFYQKNFMDERVMELLPPKPSLTYFSNSVNGGKPRGNKSLQYAVHTSIDGYIGKGTLKAIRRALKANEDINSGMIKYMKDFYYRLVRNNAKKYKRFLKGWLNRLRRLA